MEQDSKRSTAHVQSQSSGAFWGAVLNTILAVLGLCVRESPDGGEGDSSLGTGVMEQRCLPARATKGQQAA